MTFVGRAHALSRLLDAVEEAAGGRARLVLVGGEAGIGKTTLVGEAATRSGWSVGWGTCADADQAPAFWPWTTALRSLRATGPDDAPPAADAAELARLLPELTEPSTPAAEPPADPDAARLRLFDAVSRSLERLARRAPVFVVLDDLQWADESTLALLRFVTRPYRPVPLVIVAAYRHDELDAGRAATVAELAARGESLLLHGLAGGEVHELVAAVAGCATADRWAAEVHRRTDGHPFLVHQLAEMLADPTQPAGAVPSAARDLVLRRVDRLGEGSRRLVEAAAVAGTELLPDVLGEVCGLGATELAERVADGVRAGVLVTGTAGSRTRLAHDLVREAVAAALPVARRLELHQQLVETLERRHARGLPVEAADVARHAAAAVPLRGGAPAVHWARMAAAAERSRLAFAEAATHLVRARRALEDAGAPDAGPQLVDLLVDEADARARSGDASAARVLLDDARRGAGALGDADRLGRVALAVQRLGARFAMARDAIVEELETALAGVRGAGTALEAELTAGLARELRHSVPAQRVRAAPLSERALDLARTLDDPATLAACLLARHDVLWTPGRAAARRELAREITALAERTGDAERHAEGLLLTANALLELGSPAFRAVLGDYLHAAQRFRQPRHDYLALTRRAALALVDGRLDDGEQLIEEASALGERIGEPDTGNVRMSQLLGLVRARGEPDLLRATAAEAVRWWIGVPSHAHAVAAGFLALSGEPDDLDGARRHLDIVLALDTWRDDRSYLWPVFVGGMTTAAVRLDNRAVCAQLLAELEPVTDECGVNGALVCFMGSNAHWAGLLAAALGRRADAERWLRQALNVHRRLGARAWEAETGAELATLGAGDGHRERAARTAAELGLHAITARLGGTAASGAQDVPGDPPAHAELRRDGELWRVRHGATTVHLPDLKGLADLAALLARSGRDVHVLELAGAAEHDREGGPLLDATARAAYRRRLAELDNDLASARSDHDNGRSARADAERTALLEQLREAAGLAGRERPLGAGTTERARKAVSARLREAIQRVGTVLPELGAHLDRSVQTGTHCRYDPREPMSWTLAPAPPPAGLKRR
ncbi:AAA family ATPase [Actinomycetospora lutea]|uniref:ATP-binding protein n=1 Tax=Actinomycetospora lutea TaxID=663604 RepID=UPI002366C22D|nr:AAA family ATPase [Actinomycetospora lutea]MDD7942941.1 AAA family ATPase [Actinomycetospora lutea]